MSRGALTIAAVAMGTLVLAAVVFVQPGGRTDNQAPLVPPPTAAEPTFLDQRPPTSAAPAPTGNTTAGEVDPARSSNGFVGSPNALPSPQPSAAVGDAPQTWTLPASPPAPRAVDPDVEAYRAAVASPLRPRPNVDDPGATQADVAGLAVGNVPAPAATGGERRWGRQQRFIQGLGAGTATNLNRVDVIAAPGPYAIQAGTMIPAVLLTEVNSDLPGDVLAQVAHDVYDSREQQTLLIPKGSRLLGTYDSDVSSNQRRLFVAWTRLIFPDGRSIALPNLETKDRSGAGGVADRVETHRRRTLGTAALMSLIGAGAQLAQPNGGYGAFGSAPSAGQAAAGAAGQQLAQVTTEMLRKQMDAQPTIRIRQGMPFQVFLRSDIAFTGPYGSEAPR